MFGAVAELFVYCWLGLSADNHVGAALALIFAALIALGQRKLSV